MPSPRFGVTQDLTFIRKLGDTAVRRAMPIPAHAALSVLRELYHAMVWAAFHRSYNPQVLPTGVPFDPALAGRGTPSSRDELVALAAKLKALPTEVA